jgi:hypothetical protein
MHVAGLQDGCDIYYDNLNIGTGSNFIINCLFSCLSDQMLVKLGIVMFS